MSSRVTMKAQKVYIVDDDDYLCQLMVEAIQAKTKFLAQAYTEPRVFLEQLLPEQSGCVLLDVNMPKMGGIDVQQEIKNKNKIIEIIFMSAYNDVNPAVTAIKEGALDFLTKPIDFEKEDFAEKINFAIEKSQGKEIWYTKFNSLSVREKDVLRSLVKSKTNKEIARELNISFRTVEQHRASIMKKLRTNSIIELTKEYFLQT